MTSGHGGMEHPADGGPVPAGMKRAADPAYPRGSTVVLTADHVDGMAGATATIVGAYDTYTYAVDYTPTDGADPVKDHRWVVQEEMEGRRRSALAGRRRGHLARRSHAGYEGREGHSRLLHRRDRLRRRLQSSRE